MNNINITKYVCGNSNGNCCFHYRLQVTRDIPAVTVLLSKDPLDTTHPRFGSLLYSLHDNRILLLGKGFGLVVWEGQDYLETVKSLVLC